MAEKKGLKEFMEDLVKDNNLAEKFKDVVDPDKVAELAEKEGYYFTAKEYEDLAMAAVNGGYSFGQFFGDFKKYGNKFLNAAGTVANEADTIVNAGQNAYNTGKDFVNKIGNSWKKN